MTVQIPAQLSQALGGAKDPAAVVMAMFTRATAPLRELHGRVVKRTGIDEIKVADADPKKAGAQAAIIKVGTASSDPGKLAAQYAAMITVKGKAGVYVDESKRMLLRQPIGTAKSLDAEEAAPFDTESLALLGVGAQMREGDLRQVKSFDPVTLTLLIGVGVPILCVLIPIVLPMIVEWGRGAFQMISGAPPANKGPAPEVGPTDPTIPEGDVGVTVGGEAYSIDPKILVGAGAALLLLVWYLKRKG